MLNFIDNFLNKITMYRLMLYFLMLLVAIAALLSLLGKIPFGVLAILSSAVFLLIACWAINNLLAKLFRVPVNTESMYITALILALIITPVLSQPGFVFLFWVSLIAMASKYILAWQRKHIFNPAAFAVVITAFVLHQAAGWWVASSWLLPFVVIGGALVIRKLKRFDMVLSFFLVSLAANLILGLRQGSTWPVLLQQYVFVLPTFFFALVMFSEPLTAPPTKKWQVVYGALVGVLFAPQWHVGNYYSTPEIALVLGNIFSYIVSPKAKWLLELTTIKQLAPSITDFIFKPDRPVRFEPGQYLEWTLPVPKPDSRGNRRYFTIASSPTEPELHLGSKFYEQPSTFKQVLQKLTPGSKVLAGQLTGDFVLPKDPQQKLVFIAGGIGITPFRSMLKYLLDTKQARPITLFYSNRSAAEIVYQDVLDQAANQLGTKIIYALTDPQTPAGWSGHKGMVDAALITQEVPDYKERTFYVSGPHGMVTAFQQTLAQLGVPKRQIKTDFFPGYV
jgi:glycine betaine catabolism B